MEGFFPGRAVHSWRGGERRGWGKEDSTSVHTSRFRRAACGHLKVVVAKLILLVTDPD